MVALARLVVSVASLDRALRFYSAALGLEQRRRTGDVVILAGEGLELLLHERPPTPGDAGVAPSFRVADVDGATRAALEASGSLIDPPSDEPWGERQSVLHDPDGHVVCLVSDIR